MIRQKNWCEAAMILQASHQINWLGFQMSQTGVVLIDSNGGAGIARRGKTAREFFRAARPQYNHEKNRVVANF